MARGLAKRLLTQCKIRALMLRFHPLFCAGNCITASSLASGGSGGYGQAITTYIKS